MCRFSAIQAHSQTFSSAIWLCNTLPVDICQLSPDNFKPTLTVSISFEHRTMSCYYHLHCNVFIQSDCSLFAAQLLDTHLLIHSWCDIAQNQVGIILRRWWQEAQLSPRDRAMHRVSWNLANCHATVQKLLVRQVLDKSKVWSWRSSWRQCVINMCTQPWRDRVAFIVL